jgi:tetratricopeptide (TPR) repeat protein
LLPAAYVGLAVVHLHGGRQFSAALAAAQRCVELGPSDADCLMMLSIVQSRIGQAETAMQNMDKALDLSPIPPVYMNSPHALALWVNRRLDEAVRVADDCIEKAPRELGCRRLRLLALAELGRLDEARQEAAWILAQLPTATTAWIVDSYADDASSLRARATAAALAAGIPAAPPAPTGR